MTAATLGWVWTRRQVRPHPDDGDLWRAYRARRWPDPTDSPEENR